MSASRHSRAFSTDSHEEESILSTRSIEAFGRKVTATANHLIGPIDGASQHYQQALGEIHRELRHPSLQRNIFSLARASPRELVRSKLSVTEIQHRALTYLPDELLENVPENNNPFSLFQGFQASLPDPDKRKRKPGARYSRGQKLLDDAGEDIAGAPGVTKLRNEKQTMDHRLEMLGVRKNMCSTEIREIDNRIANLNSMRKIVLDRLADLEQEEAQIENDVLEVETKIEDLVEQLEDDLVLSGQAATAEETEILAEEKDLGGEAVEASFMSESIYEKLPTPKTKRPKPGRRKTNFILHEHLQAGSNLRELQAHNDIITGLDFDVPFGTMVTAALDDTVRVWDLNAGRCMGMLEGHLSSVRCLQVEDNLVATGSLDASIRVWDLSQADYIAPADKYINKKATSSEGDHDEDDADFVDAAEPPSAASMADCPVFTLEAHVAEITALHFHNSTLISGSADKTLRQWDLEKGRCVQTLDVLWAAAQASATVSPPPSSEGAGVDIVNPTWRQTSRVPDANADFVGALQVFDAALACGTADGLVRLWDLRSGQVHRSLVGHTGAVTCLQFDDVHLVTGSADRSIRIWDLRTGSIFDAYGYDNPITSMMFDARRIVAAAGESVVKVYDKTDGRHWDCGEPVLEGDEDAGGNRSIVERVRIKDGYLVEGRRDGTVGVWSC